MRRSKVEEGINIHSDARSPVRKKRRKSTQTVLDSLFNVPRDGLKPQILKPSPPRFPLRPSEAAATHGSHRSQVPDMFRKGVAKAAKRAATVIDISSSSSPVAVSSRYHTADEGSPSRRSLHSSCSSSLPDVTDAFDVKYTKSTSRKQVADLAELSPAPSRAFSSPPPKRTPLSPTKPRQRQLKLFEPSSDRPGPDEASTSALDAKSAVSEAKEAAKAAREAAKEADKRARELENQRIEAAPLLTMPMGRQPVYTRDPAEACACLRQMKGPLAWDLEWEVAYGAVSQPKVGVMQFADDRNILIFQLAKPKRIPQEIIDLLASKDCILMGVNVAGDGRKMRDDFGIKNVNGLLDLNDLARAVDKSAESRMVSLRSLTFRYLDRQLPKGRVRTSKWDRNPLKPNQVNYAALDVWATVQIYRRLVGYAEMEGVVLDLSSMATSIGAKTAQQPAKSARTPAAGSTVPATLAGRHERALKAVYRSGLQCETGEVLPLRAAADHLVVALKTIMGYLLEVATVDATKLDVPQLLSAIEPHVSVLHQAGKDQYRALQSRAGQS